MAYRSSELTENILGQAYAGWLMSDGYQVYRKYQNRVRCWAHLLRKAEGVDSATIMKDFPSPRKMKDTVREAVERGRSIF